MFGLAAGAAFMPDSIGGRLPREVPPAVAAIIGDTLKQDPAGINTDWFGTCLMEGLLQWGDRVPEVWEYGRKWLQYHLDSARLSPYSGHRSRSVRAGGIVVTTYVGHFGLSFPCHELFRRYQDAKARQVCMDLADIILHQTARNRLGMTAHDDTAEFAIPDTCYFVVKALMIGAGLSGRRVYRDHAAYQLSTHIDTFLDRSTGLAKTILFKEGIGKTYWTRASGWLLWAMTSVLRGLPAGDPELPRFMGDLRALADGIARAQDPGGGLRLYLDECSSPLETSGTVMCAMGLHEAVRRRWLPASFAPVVQRAWSFARQNLMDDGGIHGVYPAWAVPAERREIKLDTVRTGWAPGFILSTAAELTRT
jgi:hypothetical protein